MLRDRCGKKSARFLKKDVRPDAGFALYRQARPAAGLHGPERERAEALLDRLLIGRDPHLHDRIHGLKLVRDVYTPPTRGVDGKHQVMPTN